MQVNALIFAGTRAHLTNKLVGKYIIAFALYF